MNTDMAAVATPRATPMGAGESRDVAERWAAWQAKGNAQERAFRRELAVAAPILLLLAAAVAYALLGR